MQKWNVFCVISLACLIFIIGLSSSVEAQPAADSCQLVGISDNPCFTCLLQPGCGYCAARLGNQYSGCFEKNNVTNQPNDTTVCSDPDNIQGDNWIATPDGCQDPCSGSSERRTCETCTELSNCGFCQDGGGCRSGTEQGPWYNFTYCQDFRFLGGNNTKNVSQLCASYQPCEALNDCLSCVGNYEGYGQGCVWCEGPKVEGESRCLPKTANATCSSGYSKFVTFDQCPNEDVSLASVLFPLNHFALLLLGLIVARLY